MPASRSVPTDGPHARASSCSQPQTIAAPTELQSSPATGNAHGTAANPSRYRTTESLDEAKHEFPAAGQAPLPIKAAIVLTAALALVGYAPMRTRSQPAAAPRGAISPWPGRPWRKGNATDTKRCTPSSTTVTVGNSPALLAIDQATNTILRPEQPSRHGIGDRRCDLQQHRRPSGRCGHVSTLTVGSGAQAVAGQSANGHCVRGQFQRRDSLGDQHGDLQRDRHLGLRPDAGYGHRRRDAERGCRRPGKQHSLRRVRRWRHFRGRLMETSGRWTGHGSWSDRATSAMS